MLPFRVQRNPKNPPIIPELTKKELERGYQLWRLRAWFRIPDEGARALKGYRVETHTWLRAVREAKFQSMAQIAARMDVSENVYRKIELREEEGKTTLESMRKAAEALDCEFVYGLRPKDGRLFSETVWDKVKPLALRQPWLAACDPRHRALALAMLARKVMEFPSFREEQGWAKNKRPPGGGLWSFKK